MALLPGRGGNKEYDSTLSELMKMADQSRGLRSTFEPGWFLNLAFYMGDQWCFWNRGRLDKPRLPEHRLLIVDNRIMPAIMSRVAKKTKQRPIWTVTPNSPGDADVEAAELGEMFVEYMWKKLCMPDKLFEVLLWADICGAGFWKLYWDKTKGESNDFVVGPDGKSPLLGQDGRPVRADSVPQTMAMAQGQLPTMPLAQGEVCLEVRSPFCILPDPLADTLEECEWVIEEVVQSPEWVKKHFGVEMEGDTDAQAGPTEARYFPSSGGGGGGGGYKGVKVYEFWATKSSKYPNGKRCVWAKNQLLKEEDNKYDCLPYLKFTGVQVPGRFWPTSMAEQLRGPQIELNKVKSQIAENGQRIGNPSILKDRLANVEYTGVPGEEVLYDSTTPNSVPQFLQPPEMPVYVREQIQRIQESMQEISGQHEVSSSQVPAGVTAASAINLLLEQDDTRLGPAMQDMENQLSAAGQRILKMVAQYYTEERTIRMGGEDGDYDFKGFKGEMLRESYAVEVQAGSMAPVSKAAKQAGIRDTLTLFIQNGMPLDPRNLRKLTRDLDTGAMDAFFADIAVDIRQVRREIRYMYQGIPIPINGFDNDDIHIQELEDEMKSARYFRASQDPEIRQLFEGHLMLHVDRRAQAMEAQQQAMAAGQMAQAQQQHEQGMEQADQAHSQDLEKQDKSHADSLESTAQSHANSMEQAKENNKNKGSEGRS